MIRDFCNKVSCIYLSMAPKNCHGNLETRLIYRFYNRLFMRVNATCSKMISRMGLENDSKKCSDRKCVR